MKRIVQTKDTVIRDESGNERLVSTEKTIVHNVEPDAFYGTFFKYVEWMYDIHGGVPFQLILHLLNLAEFNSGRVVFSAAERKRFLKRAGCSRAALYNALKKLEEVGAIRSVTDVDTDTGEEEVARGEYVINPEMFWKGELSRRRTLRITFSSDYEGEFVTDTTSDE